MQTATRTSLREELCVDRLERVFVNHAARTFLQQTLSVKLQLRHKQTNEQTDKRTNEGVQCSL